MTGIIGVVGADSLWIFDDANARYMRIPRTPGPRARQEWGDQSAGGCQDFVWHDLQRWWLTENRMRLVVEPTEFQTFWAPLSRQLVDTRFDLAAEVRRRGPARDRQST